MVHKWISSAVLILLLMSSLGWVFYSENDPYLEGMQAPADTAAAEATAGVFTYIDASLNEMLQTTGWKTTDTMILNKPNASEAGGEVADTKFGVGGDLGVGDGGVGGTSEAEGNAFSKNTTSNKMYNSDNLDITYHPQPPVEDVWKLDANGKLIKVPYYEVKNKTWYSVGKYPAIYVPNYEESVQLSRG
jgi:hypothetical protein